MGPLQTKINSGPPPGTLLGAGLSLALFMLLC